MTILSQSEGNNVIGTILPDSSVSLPEGYYNRYHDNLTPVIPSTYTIGADGKFTSYNRGDYDPTTYSTANGMDDTIYKPVQYHPNLGGPKRIAAGTYGPDSTEVAPHLSSIHKQDSWTNSEGLWDNNSYFTTTDPSAPLGGTYSLMSNVGENADAPITYDFLNHMPDNYGTTAARGPFGLDVSDPRYTEDYSNTLHNVADNNASRAFQRKHIDAMNARLAKYDNNAPIYGVGLGWEAQQQNQPYYAVSGTSEVPLENGVEPVPLLGEWVMPNPNDPRPRLNKPTGSVLEWDEGMGPDYEWSKQNYSGYDGNRYKTQDENGSIIEYNLAHQNGVPEERAGTDFNSGDRFKKFNNIPYVDGRVNPAVHPEYMGRDGELVKWENGYYGNSPYDANYTPNYDYDYNPLQEWQDNNPQQQYDNNNQQSNWKDNYNDIFYKDNNGFYQTNEYEYDNNIKKLQSSPLTQYDLHKQEKESNYYNQGTDWKQNYNYQTNQYYVPILGGPDYYPPEMGQSDGSSTGPSYGSDYGSAMTNQMNTPSSSSGGGFGLGYDSAMTSEMGSDTASAKSFSTEYEENIKGLLDTLRGGG